MDRSSTGKDRTPSIAVNNKAHIVSGRCDWQAIVFYFVLATTTRVVGPFFLSIRVSVAICYHFRGI